MLSSDLHNYLRLFGFEKSAEPEPVEAEEEYGWAQLPDILLEDIFALLTPKARHQASRVCKSWYKTFYSPRVWETFIFEDGTLTKRRYNLFKGFTRELCPRKSQNCFNNVGSLFKKIIVSPILNFYNLLFLGVLSSFLSFYEEFPIPMLHTFQFTFACESRGINGNLIYGTGGQILQELNTLIGCMKNLKTLSINQLLLAEEDVSGLFEAALKYNGESVRFLEIINCAKADTPIPQLARFDSLQRLTVSHQHVDDEVAVLLSGTGLSDLRLVQDQYTCATQPVSADAWRIIKEIAPYLKVTLEVRGKCKNTLLLQPHAPVVSIVFDTPHSKISHGAAMDIVHFYRKTLEVFIQKGIPRVHGPRSFHERGDSSFVMLVKHCPKLKTLIINERISTATVLLLSHEGRSLKTFIVRTNAIIKRSDWPRDREWSEEFYTKLRTNARCYDRMSNEVAQKHEWKWRPLSDREFKQMV
ncbi:uncharacterized protein LOC110443697 isoform X2 [Mizuhopecten yessoensis]|uniref:uncharacterized protein LOC110443697 isoform X2 n=1 Tax=Mizuhopecten yessoensis TaxID=6573 RepID=UPI000B45BEDF|nr:uncharacterized protein LOC110443697 isoform X2 [Mizuhopecten yessoensis]